MKAWKLVRLKQTQRRGSIRAGAPESAALGTALAPWIVDRMRKPSARDAGAPDPSAEMARQFEVWG